MQQISLFISFVSYAMSTVKQLHKLLLWLTTAALISISSVASADDDILQKMDEKLDDLLNHNWEVTGFATLGYTQTDKYDDRLFRRNVSQEGIKLQDNGFLVDSRVGLQLKGDLSDHWEVVLQAVLKHQYANGIDDYIDVAFARYRASNEWQFTFGRQPFNLFLLSDHINVGYSYDFVRPPTEFYGFIPYDSFDGLKISKHWGDFDNDWNWTISVGNIKEEFETDAYDPEDPDEVDPPGDDVTKAEPIYNTALNWRSNNWHVRANFALLKFEQELDDAEELDEFVQIFSPIWSDLTRIRDDFSGNTLMRYGAIGTSWNNGEWKIQSEISLIDADFVHYHGERAYFHISRRYGDVMPYATVGYAHDNASRRYQTVQELGLPPDFQFTEIFNDIEEDIREEQISVKHNQKSLALGVRWDFSHRKALKVQCDRYWFKAGSGSIHGRTDLEYPNDESRSWCSVNVDLVF